MILLYHKVAPETPSIWWIDVDAFDRQMADLQAFEVVALDDYDPSNPRHAVITFDGVYENVWRYAFPILRKWGYPFELFVIGRHVGGDNAFDTVEPPARFATVEQLEEMARHGGRIQWHSSSHRKMDGLSPEELDAELTVAPELSAAFPAPHLRWFAYPHGDHSPAVVDAVRARFAGALSCVAGDDADRYQLNRETVWQDTRLGTSTVAVIVACYNYRAYVAEAIESVLAQTRAPDELLVIDDASTDGSDEVIARYADRVRSVRNERNLGIVGNFNKAVSLTRSDYVIFLGADNRMRADCVERCKAALDADPGVGVAYSDMLVFGPRAKVLADSVGAERVGESVLERHPVYRWRFPEPEGEALANFATRNFVHGSSMYRRAAFDAVGGYLESGGPEDHNLFRRMHEAGWGLRRVAEALIEYRQHSPTQANTALGLQIENDHLRGLGKSLRVEVEAQATRIVGLDASIVELRRRVAELEDNERTLSQQVLEERARVEQTVATLRRAEGERDRAVASFAEMRRSTSWRITAPIRFVARLARGDFLWVSRAIERGWSAALGRLPPSASGFAGGQVRRLLAITGLRPESTANAPALAAIVAERCALTAAPLVRDPLGARPDRATLPAVDVGVVTFNSSRWVERFVDSVLALDYPRDRLVLRFVDNDSTDDTPSRLEAAVARLGAAGLRAELLRRPNHGYGAGHHAAIASGDAPFCLVTNIDLEFEPDALSIAAAVAAADEDRVAAWELRQKPLEHPKFYDPVTGLTNWTSHACVLIRRSAYDRVGGYDRTLFMYAEDVELSYRFRREGFLLRYVPRAVVWHFSYESPGTVKPMQYVGSTFGNLYLRLKYGNAVDMAAVVPMSLWLLSAPAPFPGARRRVARSLAKLVAVAPKTLLSRRRSAARFPFRTWDFEMVRDGASNEVPALPAARPRVSIVTRTYRGRGAFLRQAMLSVLHQTWRDIEYIVVEDGGDTQAAIVDELRATTDLTIRHIALPKVGRSAAGNAGLAAATGRWCLFLDDDDLLFAEHVEVLVDALLGDPGAAAAYSLAWEVLTGAVVDGGATYAEVSHGVPGVLRQPFDRAVLGHHNFMAIQSVLFERRLFVERGGFEEDMDALEDWVLWNRYAVGERFVFVERCTSLYRTPTDPQKIAQRQSAFDGAYGLALARVAMDRATVRDADGPATVPLVDAGAGTEAAQR